MPEKISAKTIFDSHRDKLKLEWLSGESGAAREISIATDTSADDFSRISLIGHLNIIQLHKVQVAGQKEITYINRLKEDEYKELLDKLYCENTACIIIANGLDAPPAMIERSETEQIPLVSSQLPSHTIIDYLQHFLYGKLSGEITLHGTFMEVMGIGVLISGESGIGKSELALELVTRGHRLIADDAPRFNKLMPDIITGSCPELLQDFLEVRGLGIMNIREMYGDGAIKRSKYLRLVIKLVNLTDEEMREINRLEENKNFITILGIDVPEIIIPLAVGRNLAVLVEASVRNHILYMNNYSASEDFIHRQAGLINGKQAN